MTMRDSRANEQNGSSSAPPLPPSPLTEVVEVEPFERLRLPWTTLLFALLGALLPGPILSLAFLRVHPDAYVIGGVGAVMAGVRALVLAFGATAADRVVNCWPRMARWGLGLAILGLVPGLEQVPMGFPAFPNWAVIRLAWMAGAAVRDGLIGAISGYLLLREGDVLRARCIGTVVIWGVYVAYDFYFSGPLTGIFSGTETTQFVLTQALAGCLLPVAFALSLRLAWRQVLEPGTHEGQ